MTTTTIYPQKLVISFFPDGADTSDTFLKLFDNVYTVNDHIEEESLYTSLFESNITILYPDGKII
jgi:hypothetical protein